ncbi:MAG: glycosyltransferase [Phycisphaerae bacterium]
MNIIVFVDSFLETSGVGTYYRTLLDWCEGQDGVSMTVVCPDPAGAQDYPVTDHVIAIRPHFRCRFPIYPDVTVGHYPANRLRRIIEETPSPKVVHIASSGPLGMAAARVARRLKTPMVGCYHTDMQARGRVYGRRWFGRAGEWVGEVATQIGDKLAYGGCEGLYAPSATAIAAPKAFYDGKTEVITNPVDTHRFRPSENKQGWFREKYKRDGRALAIGVGRIAKEKSFDRLCALLVPDKRVDLVLVGDGPQLPELQSRWHVPATGFLKGDELVEAYQQADLYVQVSTSETFGLCLIEALACGLPAVALRAPGLTSQLEPGCGADILAERELPTMAQQCADLATDESRYSKYAEEGRAYAMRCGTEGVLPKLLAFHTQYAR